LQKIEEAVKKILSLRLFIGSVAERLGKALQKPLLRFESGRYLTKKADHLVGFSM